MAHGGIRAGGILGLVDVLIDHWDVIEADLHRHYGVDLLDVFRAEGRLSWRKLRVLIEQLPPDSRTKHALAGVDPDPWTVEAHILAMVRDAVVDLTWLTASVHSKRKPPMPERLPRPGDQAKPKQGDTPTIRPSQLQRWMSTGEITHG